jgi:hypothetical protein
MIKVQAIGIKEKDKPFHFVNSAQYKKELDLLPPGRYKITTEKQKRKASPEQFRYLYGLVYPLSLIALNDAGYEFTNIDQVDIFWKEIFANKEVLNRETGEIMKLPLSKSEFMTVDEMTFCDAIRNYCLEYFNTVIPDPDPNWKQYAEIH